MAQIKADRVKETTETTGTSNLTLAGASVGYQPFSSVMANGDTCYYVISHRSNGEWETGYGTYVSAGNQFSRSMVSASSNGGNPVNFSAGLKDIAITLTSGQLGQVLEVPNGTAVRYGFDSNGFLNRTLIGNGVLSSLYGAGSTSTGTGLVAIGEGSCGSMTQPFATYCTFVGGRTAQTAGSSSMIGSTLVGYESGFNFSGSVNTYIGYRTGFNAAGGGNVGVGGFAIGQSVTSSNSSVFVGYGVGSSKTGITKCIYVGSGTTSIETVSSNEIVIGCDAVGQGSNTTVLGNSSTTATYIFGNLIPSGAVAPASLADSAAPNNAIYFSTTAGKLVYKDAGGSVNNLY